MEQIDNTERVAATSLPYTVRSVTAGWPLVHNLCMSKYTETTIIRGMRAADARNRLIAARKANGWSQKELAMKTGWIDDGRDAVKQPEGSLSPSQIGNFEQGTRSIGMEDAEILGRVFEVPSAWFVGAVSKQEAEIIQAARGGKRGEIHEPRAQDRVVRSTDAASGRRKRSKDDD